MQYPQWQLKPLFVGTILVLVLSLLLVACGGSGSSVPTRHASTATPGTGESGSGAVASTTPGIGLGVQPCPLAVKSPSYWDAIIPTQPDVSHVESVSCGNLVGNPTLQALVTVRYNGSGALLDVYVYNNITSPNPDQIFKLQSLYKGEAKMSRYDTVITAEVDLHSSVNLNKDNASLTQDLFREFKWSDGAGTLVPVAFPGIFPDLSRFQAEADQAQVNAGHSSWKLSATMTANALAVRLLGWPVSAATMILRGGGTSDSDAVVNVTRRSAGGGTITVTLSRLEGNTNGGIWEATSVESSGMSIAAPPMLDRLRSPVTITGTRNALEGKIGKISILDHLYDDIGHADVVGAAGTGNTSFSTNVTYDSTFHNGAQEGLVVFYAYGNADGSIVGAVMVKELLS